MFNTSIVTSELYGLVGWRQPFNPDYNILDAGNLASVSGLFVNEIPYSKVEYVKDSQDYAAISDADFNTYLKRLQEESVISICHSVFNRSDYIDRNLFYINPQNKSETETLPTGFVGFRIEIDNTKDIAFKITRMLLDFSGTGNITLQLYNSNDISAPIESQVVNITTNHQEVVLNWVVDNSGTRYKGEFYLGYRTQGLVPVPYKREWENSDILSDLTHLEIEEIKVDGHATDTLFDLDDVDGMSETTGLNPDITVYEDYTDLIKQNRDLFARAIQLDVAIASLSVIVASVRSNKNERIGKDLLTKMLIEIEGNDNEGSIKKEGLRTRLSRSIKEIRTKIDSIREGYFGGRIMVDTLM